MMKRVQRKGRVAMPASSLVAHAMPGLEEAAADPAASQSKVSRSLINVTSAHRDLAFRQFVVQQIAYWLTVIGLIVTEASAPVLKDNMMEIWLIVTFVTWVIRALLFVPVYKLSQQAVKESLLLKLIPLMIIGIACFYWIWTIELFSGPRLTVRELFMCMGVLSISISMTGMWPVTPVAVIVYNVVLWGAFTISLYHNKLATWPVIVVFNLAVGGILCLNVFIASNQARDEREKRKLVGDLNKDLQQANEELETLKNHAYQKLDTRSRFFAEGNHDLKQQVHGFRVLVVAAQIAAKKGTDVDPALERLGQNLDSLEEWMTNILDFARTETLDANVKLRSMAVQTVFQKLNLHFEDISQAQGEQLHFRFTKLRVGTDASMLDRMLRNLISNALKFTRGRVLVCARQTKTGISLEVWDQGHGIKEETQMRIFDAYYQGEQDGLVQKQGVGLGLAIVKRFATRLNYKVQFRSVVGRGTVFKILIPAEFTV
jgi:signal transduction histidine kinase